MTDTLATPAGSVAYDDHGGNGPLLLLLPGAGDVRSEHRFLVSALHAEYRVITADLRGHGESSIAATYGMSETAADMIQLIRHLDAGPAVVIGNSFAPAAALWAAAGHSDLIAGIVLISPHLHAGGTALQNLATRLLLRGPWAGSLWAKLYAGWYKSDPPKDLDTEVAKLKQMMGEAGRRRAVRETLLANRNGLDDRIARLAIPTLTVFGSKDDHFPDPESEAKRVVDAVGGRYVMVDGAGHYPHVEQPDAVAGAIRAFLAEHA